MTHAVDQIATAAKKMTRVPAAEAKKARVVHELRKRH